MNEEIHSTNTRLSLSEVLCIVSKACNGLGGLAQLEAYILHEYGLIAQLVRAHA